MNLLNGIFLHILYSSLVASILILLIIAIKKIFHRHLSVRFYHALWLLVLIRLLMPVQVESPFGLGQFFPADIRSSAAADADFVFNQDLFNYDAARNESQDSVNKNEVHTLSSNILLQLEVAWLAGVLLLLLLSISAVLRYKMETRNLTAVIDPGIQALIDQCRKKLHIKRAVPVYKDSYFKSPCTAGIINPVIYFPGDICRQIDQQQLQYILLHELAHYKRKDLFFNLLAALAAMLHWFNPLVWWAVKEMRCEREIACDTYVMEVLGEDSAIPYGRTILNLSRLFSNKGRQFNLVSFNETNSHLERRINMIKSFKKGSYRISALAIITCVLIGALTLTNAIGIGRDDNPITDTMAGLDSPLDDKIKEKLVVIDPGHGGDDMGGFYPFDQPELAEVKEKNLNLDIALKLNDMLRESGIKVAMTRREDQNVSLDDRVKLANSLNAALFVGVHSNAYFLDDSINGTMSFFRAAADDAALAAAGKRAAQLLQEEMVGSLETTDLGISATQRIRVLTDTRMPAVLTEIAYISNDSDRKKLTDEEFRTRAARALHDGIIKVLKEMAATESPEEQNK